MRRALLALVVASAALTAPAAHAAGYSGAVLGTPGLAGYYRLADTAGSSVAIDTASATGATNGTYTGTGRTAGQPGAISDANHAVRLSSGTVALGTRAVAATTGAFTVEAWAKPASLRAQHMTIAQKNGAFALRVLSSGAVVFQIRADGTWVTVQGGAAQAGRWVHAVGTYDASAGTMRLSVDGVQVASATRRGVPPVSGRLDIGSADGQTAFFDGTIDDVSFYSRPLTAAEAVAHHRAGTTQGAYADAVLGGDVAPLSYWRLGERSGATAVDARGARPGSYLGGPVKGLADALQDDPDASAAFDGVDDAVSAGDAYGFPGRAAFSVEAWVRRTGGPPDAGARIMSKETAADGGWALSVVTGGRLEFQRRSAARSDRVGADMVLEDGVWHHVIVTYDATTLRMYVDGQRARSTVSTVSLPVTPAPLTIGRASGGGQHFRGGIDEPAVYGSALSVDTLRRHVAARIPFRWGISANTNYSVRKDTPPNQVWAVGQMDKLRASGIMGADLSRPRMLREVIPSEVDLDPSRWDPYWRNAAQRGFSILPVILPDESTRVPSDPAVQAKAASVAAQYAGRYGPGGAFWRDNPDLPATMASRAIEIFNEPWYGPLHQGYFPQDYARLLRASYLKVKAARPSITVLAELVYRGHVSSSTRASDTWLTDLRRTVPNIADYFDAGAVHPYTNAGQDPATCDPAAVRWCFQDIRQIRWELEGITGGGGLAKQLWITENGASTCPNAPTLCVPEGSYATGGAPCASSADRSHVCVTARAIESSRVTLPFIDGYVHYAWEDRPDPGGRDQEMWFGLVRTDGTRKPAGNYMRDLLGREP